MSSRKQKNVKDVKKIFPNFIAFPGIKGGKLYFDPEEGHFYRYFVLNSEPWKCCSNQIISFFKSKDGDNQSSGMQPECTAIVPRDKLHNHAVPCRSSVEFHTFYWACQMHMVQSEDEITPNNAMIQAIASTWPLKHFTGYTPLLDDDLLVSKLKTFSLFMKGSSKMEKFQNNFGNQQLTKFMTFLKSEPPYWSPHGGRLNNSQGKEYRKETMDKSEAPGPSCSNEGIFHHNESVKTEDQPPSPSRKSNETEVNKQPHSFKQEVDKEAGNISLENSSPLYQTDRKRHRNKTVEYNPTPSHVDLNTSKRSRSFFIAPAKTETPVKERRMFVPQLIISPSHHLNHLLSTRDATAVPVPSPILIDHEDSANDSDSSVEFIGEKQAGVLLVKPLAPVSTQDSKNDNKELEPPTGLKVDSVTAKTAKLSWTAQNSSFSYRLRYWPKGQPALATECPSPNNSCSLEHLNPETTYSVSAMAVSEDGLYNSASKEIIELTTISENLRFAEMLKHSSTKIEGNGGMQLYSVPLVSCSMPGTALERFVFGTPDATKQNRNILLIGAGDSGKSTLVDAMINYIFNVQWEDNFRFQLTKKRPSKTNRISVYEIHHAKGFRIPYPLTIINAPGFSGDLKADEEIAKKIRQCVGGPEGAQQLAMIGFVVQSLPRQLDMQTHIFYCLRSIFGKSVIKEKVKLLITFADKGVPPILDFIVDAGLPCSADSTEQPIHYKFNNSGFFCLNQQSSADRSSCAVDKFNRLFWNMGMESFLKLFSAL